MLFFYRRIIITIAIFCAPALSVYSQYAGGTGSGSIQYSKLQTSCPSISLPAIFTGGPHNGLTQAGITQSICSPLIMPAIFKGGSGNIENSNLLNAGCVPFADFEVDTTNICAGNMVYFTDLSRGNPTSWSWSFPGGVPATSTIQNPSVRYDNSGSFDVALTITAPLGNSTITKTSYVTVLALPSVSLSSISPLCESASAYLLTEGSPIGGTYGGSGIASGIFDPSVAGAGTHNVIYKYEDGFGCSDSAEADIIVNPVYNFNNSHEICEGETYNWQGADYSSANIYTANYTSINGCDSIYTLNLTVNPAYAFTEDHSICEGETYNWQGADYTTANTYTASYTTIKGCDSIYTLNLTVNQVYAFAEDHSICEGETYNWQGADYTTANTYTASYTSIHGCDSIYTLNLTVNPVYAFAEDHSICEGETYNWQGADYTKANTYTASYTSINGCDSIYTLNLTVNPAYAFTEDHSICEGETYNWQGTNYTTGDTYTANYTSIHGCDSIYTLNLTVNAVDIALTVNDQTITANATGATYQWLDCANLYSPVDGAVSQSYTASVSGNYAVLITQNSCTDTSACVQIIVLGIPTISAEIVSVYPNPVSQNLTIEIKGNKVPTDFEILNSSGQVVYKGSVQEKAIVPTSKFAPGVYLLKLEQGKRLFFNKIIKE